MEQKATHLPQLKIVLVEDDATVRLFMRESLEQLGHAVIGEADNGTEMVKTVLAMEPDMVVFDIHLPLQDGLSALREIYKERILAAVAITADRDQDLVRRALEEHVLAYLVKPVEAYQLGPALQIAWARFQELRDLTTANVNLRQSLQGRKLIERAKGILMDQHRWSEPEAFRRLQRAAMNSRQSMTDLAQAIIAGDKVEL
jgi:response regulator NasT